MTEILSQSEIDALIAALSTGEVTVDQIQKEEKQGKVRVYDFRRPDKFSKDQIRTLHMLHDTFSRLVTTQFSGLFRTIVQLSIVSVDQIAYKEFTSALANPAIIAVFGMEPLKGNALLEVSPAVGLTMIDRLFGGPGQAVQRSGALTEIETTVMERVITGMLSSLREAWKNIIELRPKLETIETNPLFAQIVAPNEIAVVVTIEARIGEAQGIINLCIPYLVIEPVVSRLSARHWFASAQREASAGGSGVLQRRLESTRLPVIAVLGQATITVGEFMRLQAGDVVRLDTDVGGQMTVMVGDKPKFRGKPGVVRNRLAVSISKAVRESEGESNE